MASVILIRGSATFCIPTNNNDSVIFTESLININHNILSDMIMLSLYPI